MLLAQAVEGLPEVTNGSDLGALLTPFLAELTWPDGSTGVVDSDVLVIASKIIAKAEGRLRKGANRDALIAEETVRVVARREREDGTALQIVENKQGLVMAAAGIDASNVHPGTVLLLPEDPDESARRLRRSLNTRLGARPGVIVTDTTGRPWRQGVADFAIGAAGVKVLEDLRGTKDRSGRELSVSVINRGDEIAAAADLVRSKGSGHPVVVVRGVGETVTAEDGPGAKALQMPAELDLFRTSATD